MDTTAAVLIIIGCVLLACIAILVCICACKRKSVVGDKNDKNLQKAKEHAENKKRFGQRGKHYEPGQVMSNQPTQGQQANAPDVVIVSTVPQYDWTFMKSPQTQFFEEQRRREEAAGAQPGDCEAPVASAPPSVSTIPEPVQGVPMTELKTNRPQNPHNLYEVQSHDAVLYPNLDSDPKPSAPPPV